MLIWHCYTDTVTTLLTQQSADENSQSAEEPDEGKSFKSGFEEAVGWATTPLTLTSRKLLLMGVTLALTYL